MACLQRFGADVSWGCSSGARGGSLGRYTEALLINASDIDSFSGGGGNATVTMKRGARGYILDIVNNSVKVTVSKKGGEFFPVMYDPSVTMKIPTSLFSSNTGSASTAVNSDLVFALKGTNNYTIIGLGAPLSCTEIEGDSTASEFLTLTFGTGEDQTGSTIYGISKATYEALKVPAV